MENNKSVTAVKWLEEKLKNIKIIDNYEFLKLQEQFEEAKIKEREQIRSAYMDGQDDVLEKFLLQTDAHLNSLHYYQKKFKK